MCKSIECGGKMTVTKENVIKELVNNGFNKDDAVYYVEKEFDFVVKCYPDASTKAIAEYVTM